MSQTRVDPGQQRADEGTPPTTFLGFSVSVSHTAHLPAALSEEGWNRLVDDLRETFGARGEVRSDGPRRQWWNGHLRALAEPSDAGGRLHLRTLKGTARHALTRGVVFVVVGVAILAFQGVSGGLALDTATAVAALSIVLGGWSIGATARTLPRWRAKRKRQMEAIAERAAEATAVEQKELGR